MLLTVFFYFFWMHQWLVETMTYRNNILRKSKWICGLSQPLSTNIQCLWWLIWKGGFSLGYTLKKNFFLHPMTFFHCCFKERGRERNLNLLSPLHSQTGDWTSWFSSSFLRFWSKEWLPSIARIIGEEGGAIFVFFSFMIKVDVKRAELQR